MTEPFFTIGHSTRSLEELLQLLQASEISLVVDVRKLPGSRKYPQFNENVLADALRRVDIDFRRAEQLTGRRPVSEEVPFDVNAWWENRSFHNYADHALSAEFADGLRNLQAWGNDRRLAVMCSEAVWWRCHRRIIADHLLAHGKGVQHILGVNQVSTAQLTSGAVVGKHHVVTYPAGS